jgi:ribosomal protein L14E/L6E/L27E
MLADVMNKWENSSWGKKLIVQKRRAALNDFDRFKVMLAKIKVRFFDMYSLHTVLINARNLNGQKG